MSRSEVTVTHISDPPPSDDELLFHQWMAELGSFMNMEAIVDSNSNFDEAWEKALKSVEVPEYTHESFLSTNSPKGDELKNLFRPMWKKIKEQNRGK